MKQAWLVMRRPGDEWEILFVEPEHWRYSRILPIAYIELKEGRPAP